MPRKRSKRTKAAKKTTAPVTPTPPIPTLSDLLRDVKISMLRTGSSLLHQDRISSVDKWHTELGNELNIDGEVVRRLVEPELCITIGQYFGRSAVANFKDAFESVACGRDTKRAVALKIARDTITRLDKKAS